MNIKLNQSKFVDIEGLTEAAALSTDSELKTIINYAELAASHNPEANRYEDDSMHPLHQLREACFHELCRRHGDDYMLPESTLSDFRIAA
ncbi:hypothetical protein Ga0123461_1277 [Mariprofundus aestuarium]|uniref:Uncharacterized protein n=2 Tax=Mariprofundus aestuarium TaxID=1921086 RepID=A0A2K8KXL9_MARES|nr:hypothetical protein Ga0123461_1277 [Mariprofundus aestuarium]